jgi:DNA polymerase elongation subunit (family B)
MLVDFEYKSAGGGNLICSYIDKSGNIKLKYYPWTRPTKFITTSDDDPEKDGKYVTWDGKSTKQIYTRYPNRYSVYDFLDHLPKEEQDILFEYNEPNIFFVDIENEITDKKPQPQLAETAILSISIVHKNKALVLGTGPLSDKEIEIIRNDINSKYGSKFDREYEFKYTQYQNEYELLLNFFKVFVPKMAVITGWNFIAYDWVFLVNRARKIGVDPTYASLTRNLKEPKNPQDFAELPAHRIIVDYMELFSKWDTSIKVKESNALDFVASKVLGVKKVNYEGNLKILYETDFKNFIFYNAIDSILVQLIHEKSKYIDILYGVGTLSKITVTSAFSTLAVTEGILRRKLRDQKNIVLCKLDNTVENSSDEGIKGGWVKDPIVGLASWTVCFDFASLYPTTMREFNISADSYKGQRIKNKDYSLFNGHQIPLEKNDIITINGSVFRNETGVVKQVMSDIYSDRKRYKGIMMQKHEELEETKRKIKELEGITKEIDLDGQKEIVKLRKKADVLKSEYDYNKAMQLALKLVLNGTYGAFANPYFVVSNSHIANAITAQGRDVIQYMIDKIEDYFFNKFHEDTVVHELLGTEYIGQGKTDNKYYILNKNFKSVKKPYEKIETLEKFEGFYMSSLEKVEILNAEYFILGKRNIFNYKGIKKITKPFVVYGDTDSAYLSFAPMMEALGFKPKNHEDALAFILHLNKIFIRDLFNSFLVEYAKPYLVENIHDFELETINQSALHVKKKHYINSVIYEDSIFYDPLSYFNIKGIEIVRRSSPIFVRGENFEGGIWDCIKYIFKDPENVSIREILKLVKDMKKQFMMAPIEDISMSTNLANYRQKCLDDQKEIVLVKGAHFSVKAASLHNYLLNKNSDLKTKYDLLTGGKIKYYYCDHSLGNVFGYLRSFHPDEITDRERLKLDYDMQFEKCFLNIINRLLVPIGLPEITKRLSVLNSLFDKKVPKKDEEEDLEEDSVVDDEWW